MGPASDLRVLRKRALFAAFETTEDSLFYSHIKHQRIRPISGALQSATSTVIAKITRGIAGMIRELLFECPYLLAQLLVIRSKACILRLKVAYLLFERRVLLAGQRNALTKDCR